MKKNIFGAVTALLLCAGAASAQQTHSQQTLLRPDGSQMMTINDADGSVSTITAAKGESIQQKYLEFLKSHQSTSGAISGTLVPVATTTASKHFVSHTAVLGKNGTQEIHLLDASNHETVISAQKGESVQQKYWEYLKANGLPCACGGAEAPKVSNVTTNATSKGTMQSDGVTSTITK